jgi:hypothetical protein
MKVTMKDLHMYESKISDAKWLAYDIPGNIGWIAFHAGLILCFTRKPEMMEHPWIFVLMLLNLLCGLAMLVGVGELISERIQRLDRVLPQKRLYRGFGALMFGGIGGTVFSLVALAITLIQHLNGAGLFLLMSGGGLLCCVFAGLIMITYKKI